jgi:predicted Ser/Thr protein kinase
MRCPSCSGELSPTDRFCRSCGAPLISPSEAPTYRTDTPAAPVAAAGTAPVDAPVGRLISSGSIPVGGFTPGMVLADRYRIIGLLGRGGMGEVYRADDLKLGQAVALKFLPKALADDPVRRERFHAEVRIARQVSHPNICRVYDIGELDGRHFLTMEYVDGEDLASLLKRIGRLPGDKAIDVARQLCAGLAAAHDKGVLHRDLKPANVMIDGRGRVRITDFGLAMAAGEDLAAGEVSGTPAYMAPEQFAGKGASVRSDIYALGLVLYELYTGRHAFEAATLAELRAKKETATPTAPSEITREIDPIVDRVIRRCLEKDPRHRPGSVVQVAAALPGGDPLAAAIAAGETPSPEMVAASGITEGLRPWVAWTCLAFVILGSGAAAVLGGQAQLFRRVPLEKPPDALVERARAILSEVGYTAAPADSAWGFETDDDYLQYVRTHDRSVTRWDRLADSAIQFRYRQSPRTLVHWLPNSTWFFPGVTSFDPPSAVTGESLVWLDGRGRLLALEVIPPQVDESPGTAQAPDWSVLFREAGLDPSKWVAAEPTWTPPRYADARAAWRGVLPEHPDVAMRIEAAAYRGKPVYWQLIGPWTRPFRVVAHTSSPGERAASILMAAILVSLIVGGAFFARRNLRMGRGDRHGAARLGYLALGLLAVVWVFGESHVPTFGELALFFGYSGSALFISGFLWLLYISLEPFVRRRWPGSLISWSRLLSGSIRDPLVGRDVLVGCVLGVVGVLLFFLTYGVASWIGVPQEQPFVGPLRLFLGARAVVAVATWSLVSPVFFALAMLFMLFLLRVLLRSEWAAVVLLVMILTAPEVLQSDAPLLIGIANVLAYGVTLFVLARFGLLAVVVSFAFGTILQWFPITTELSAWYFGIGLTGVLLLLGLTAYAFYTSLGGQPLFGRVSLEDVS